MKHFSFFLKKKPVSIQFFFSYLLLIICFILAFLLVDYQLNKSLKDAIAENGMEELKKAADVFELRLEELNGICYSLSLDPHVRQAAAIPRDGPQDKYAALVSLDLEHYYINNKMISGLYLWFPKPEIAKIGNSFVLNIYPELRRQNRFNGRPYDQFFESAFAERPDVNLQWADVDIPNREEQSLFYCVNLQNSTPSRTEASAFFAIDQQELQALFQFFPEEEQSGLVLLDADGAALFASREQLLEKNEPYDAYSEKSARRNTADYVELSYRPQGSRLYLLYLSKTYFQSQMRNVRFALILTYAACCILVFILAGYLSRRNSAPIRKIAAAFPAQSGNNEYEAISRSISSLLADKAKLEQNISEQMQLRRESFYSKLLFGGFSSEAAIMDAMTSLKLTKDYPYYLAFCMRFTEPPADRAAGSGDQLFEAVAVSQLLNRTIPALVYLSQVQDNTFAGICGGGPELSARLQEQLEQAASTLKKDFHINVFCGIGLPYTELNNLFSSCREAQSASDKCALTDEQRVIAVDRNHLPGGYWDYTVQVENRLVALCRAGDQENACALIHQFFMESVRQHTSENIQLAYDFRGTFLKILSDLAGSDLSGMSASSNRLTQLHSLEELEKGVCTIVQNICLLVRQTNQKKRNDLYLSILAYLRRQYADPSLSLTSVADNFNLSESHLSHFFKQQHGDSFSSAVEKIRMEHVLSMMRETSLSIAEISAQCGYSNTNSFYKAFKRIYQVSPNVYRKSMQETGGES